MEPTVKVNNVQQSLDTPEREADFNRRRAAGHESEYQKNRREWFENPDKRLVADYPLHVDLELSSACNLTCPMCPTVTDYYKANVDLQLMKFDLFKKLVDEIGPNGVYSIRVSWVGESTMHKRFIDCIKYAKAAGIKEVSTLTNGYKLMAPEFCDQVVESQLDWITVSVDGVDKVYEDIRKPITFKDIQLGLKNLKEARERAGSLKPGIKIQGVWPAVKQNADKYMDVFTPITDLIYTNPLIDYLHNDKDIEYVPQFTCYQPFQRLVIRSNGDAVMCSNDDMGHTVVGDANTETVHEIWHGKRMGEVRRMHIEQRATSENAVCARCYVPRAREFEEAVVKGRKVFIEGYKGRTQVIGK
ncbi:MAG: radical SAM protein [Elusimicrobia bacterium]|nr:radical SAM protein [Elusimicrobiota bacterium]